MLWVERRSTTGKIESNQRRSYRQSIELPIAIEVSGLPAPVYGTLINISESGCRLRSLILIDREREVSFELRRPGHRALALRGRVVSRTQPLSGAGFEYGLKFRVTSEERTALFREIQEMQRREAAARANARQAERSAPAAPSRQRRGSVRTLVGFAVKYRIGNRALTLAEANDLSTGGLRLTTSERLIAGSTVELRFTLPSSILWVYPHPEQRTEITPFGPRSVRIPDNRRPFEEMTIHGRVLSRFAPTRGREVYGVQFTDIDGYQREEIARFTHAVQLARLRTE
jgi:c-di-GMP-binding flagellar brake protein YcgR